MERQLPTYEIKGIPFIVDVDYNLLRHPENERIAYNFFDDMEDKGTHYHLRINGSTLATISPDNRQTQRGEVVLDIPQMVKLDPAGVAEKFLMPQTALPVQDRDLKNNEDLMMRRKMGKPAAIKIQGDYFFVDALSGYLMTPGAEPMKTGQMPLDHFQTCYRCLYDPVVKMEYKAQDGTPIPERIVAIEIPHIRFADSYNYRKCGQSNLLSDAEWFRRYPVRSNMEARVVPLEKLGYSRRTTHRLNKVEPPADGENKGKAAKQQSSNSKSKGLGR